MAVTALAHENLDAFLRIVEKCVAASSQPHSFFVATQRLLEAEIAILERCDHGAEILEDAIEAELLHTIGLIVRHGGDGTGATVTRSTPKRGYPAFLDIIDWLPNK